jgi:hypothetical protein
MEVRKKPVDYAPSLRLSTILSTIIVLAFGLATLFYGFSYKTVPLVANLAQCPTLEIIGFAFIYVVLALGIFAQMWLLYPS